MELPKRRKRLAEPAAVLDPVSGTRNLLAVATESQGREDNSGWKKHGGFTNSKGKVLREEVNVDGIYMAAEDNAEPGLEQRLVIGGGNAAEFRVRARESF